MAEPEAGRVECYSGHTYAQEPRAVVWQGRRHLVTQVERSWQSPDGPGFEVRTEAGARFALEYDEGENRWMIRELQGQGGPESK